jgi:hypothetical protein
LKVTLFVDAALLDFLSVSSMLIGLVDGMSIILCEVACDADDAGHTKINLLLDLRAQFILHKQNEIGYC